MRHTMRKALLASFSLAALALALVPASPAYAAANIIIVNNNAPGVGFNDPTPVAPVGGNPGTTIGQQRLIAFQAAADIWGATLDSNVTIKILAQFSALACTSTGATLGSAGTIFIWANFPAIPPFPGPEFPETWYSQALASKRLGQNISPVDICTGGLRAGQTCASFQDCPNANPPTGFFVCSNADISANFNINLGTPACPAVPGWYYGLDNNHGNLIDLVTVLLHEFGHGLGFQQFASTLTGAQPGNRTDTYGRQLLDLTLNKTWNQMTNAERAASTLNSRKVVWTGAKVTGEVPSVLSFGVPNVRVNSPGAIAGNYDAGTASFGDPITAVPITGDVVAALDAANPTGPTTLDACTALTNAADVAGKVALVNRGTCGFIVKAANVQAAGAIAMLVADNVADSPPAGLGGVDPALTVPSVRITQATGNAIRAQLAIPAVVNASVLLDTTLRAGADAFDRAMLNTPNPRVAGSSVSHWDPVTFPNQLMEPAINGDLTHQVTGVDLTLGLMRDIGWFPDADVEGIADADDNCPNVANADQADNDHDNLGDVCDADDDNDGVEDTVDNCVFTANADQADFDLDGIGDVCDPQTGPPLDKSQCMNGNFARFDTPVSFPNQGQCVCYVETDGAMGPQCAVVKSLGLR